MEKYVKENFDLKSVKRLSELDVENCRAYLTKLIRNTSFTQEGFAKLVGIDPAKLSRTLSGKTMPSLKMYCLIQNGVEQIFSLCQEFEKSKKNENNNPV